MDFSKINTKMVIVVSSKSNPKYKEFIKILDDKNNKKLLQDKNINVMENTIDDKNLFELQLYDLNMLLIHKINNIDTNVINNIITIFDEISKEQQKIKKGGARINYKYKYEKYKQKYTELKNKKKKKLQAIQ